MRQSRELIGVGQRAMGDGGTKPQPIELVVAGAQADFYVGQAIPVSDLSKGHGKELVPTREVINLAVAMRSERHSGEIAPGGSIR